MKFHYKSEGPGRINVTVTDNTSPGVILRGSFTVDEFKVSFYSFETSFY